MYVDLNDQKYLEELALKNIGIIRKIIDKTQISIEAKIDSEKVAHKIVADSWMEQNDYINAFPHYEASGNIPTEVVRKIQLIYMLSLTSKNYSGELSYLNKYKKLVSNYGKQFSNQDVEETFILLLQDTHNERQFGEAYKKGFTEKIKSIEEETNFKFNKKLIDKAYQIALKRAYVHCVSNIFYNSNKKQFKSNNKEEVDLVNNFIQKNMQNHLAISDYIHLFPKMVGISAPYKLIFNVGKEKTKEYLEDRLHVDYMKEYIKSVENLGFPVLANYLYKNSISKKSKEYFANKIQTRNENWFKKIIHKYLK